VAVPAGTADLEELADVLQAGLWDDPVARWLLPDEPSRSRRLARVWRVLLRSHYLPMRSVWTTSDQAGAALWAPPGHAGVTGTELRGSARLLLSALGCHTVRAGLAVQHRRAAAPSGSYWRLGALVTNPGRRGEGIGTALLGPGLRRCDAEGTGAYLEVTSRAAVRYFGRHGFAVRAESALPWRGPTVWSMWRDPRETGRRPGAQP